MQRFDHNAESDSEIVNYIRNRRLQLLADGYEMKSLEFHDYGAHVQWTDTSDSFYIRQSYRGRGLYERLANFSARILTSHDCNLADFLESRNIHHTVACDFQLWPEYKLISNFYGSKKANRSGCYLMDHIDGGLFILRKLGAIASAQKAFLLHPMLQSDKDFAENFDRLSSSACDRRALMLAVEYRSVANEYLSTRTINSVEEIRLSPIKCVNDMLIADKIQNYKDFLKFHAETHERRKELDQYFRNWLKKLDCEELFVTVSETLNNIEAV